MQSPPDMKLRDAGQGYAGDLSPQDAMALLTSNPSAQLVDVRTAAEWTFVGGPDLAAIGKKTVQCEWQRYPGMQTNEAFADELTAALKATGASTNVPLLFLCRSGARSKAAALKMTAAGAGPCFNILGGFEGDLDSIGHRGAMTGWKVAGLPWRQS